MQIYLSHLFTFFSYPNISFFLFIKYILTFLQPMQTIETYTPLLSNLHVTPFQSMNTIIDDVNPLN